MIRGGGEVKSTHATLDNLFIRRGSKNTNAEQIKKLKLIVRRVIEEDLTDKQKRVIQMYYFEGKKMTEIAEEMRINKSTVSRHLKLADKKFQKIKKYSVEVA